LATYRIARSPSEQTGVLRCYLALETSIWAILNAAVFVDAKTSVCATFVAFSKFVLGGRGSGGAYVIILSLYG
jgi:hypothetical protein